MIRTVIVAFTITVTFVAALRADVWDDQVATQMEFVVANAAIMGFDHRGDSAINRLRDGEMESLVFTLDPSREHLFAGVCDFDCLDLDLVLLELDGVEVVGDRRLDNLPIVVVPAGHQGTHTLRVSMPSCSVNPCRYQVVLFSR